MFSLFSLLLYWCVLTCLLMCVCHIFIKITYLLTYFVTERWVRSWSRCTGSQPACEQLLTYGLIATGRLSAYWQPTGGNQPGRLSILITFRQACSHLPSRKKSPFFDQCQVILLVTEAHRCEQLFQGCYAALLRWEWNPLPIDRKSNVLPLRHCATFLRIARLCEILCLFFSLPICFRYQLLSGWVVE